MDKTTKDLLERAAWTGLQSFLAVFLIGLADVFNSFQSNTGAGKTALIALAVSALAAGLSAVKSAVIAYRS